MIGPKTDSEAIADIASALDMNELDPLAEIDEVDAIMASEARMDSWEDR